MGNPPEEAGEKKTGWFGCSTAEAPLYLGLLALGLFRRKSR
jgi:MYXO-CTERM domain-containing protein